MNQTANYGLSQWEDTDRILMEDFNSDNSKIDTTLKENADNIAASRGGERTALLSIPQRNMHTPVEIVDTADIEAVANLIAAYLCDNFSLEGFGC